MNNFFWSNRFKDSSLEIKFSSASSSKLKDLIPDIAPLSEVANTS